MLFSIFLAKKLLFILNIVKDASLCTIICEIVKNRMPNIFKDIIEYNYVKIIKYLLSTY